MRQYRPHLFVLFALAATLLTGVPSALKGSLTDLRFHWFPRQASGKVVLVAIDARSIEAIGVWPWPRRTHADLLHALQRAGATDIGLDIDFSSPSTPESDALLADALKEAGGSVILPAFKQIAGDASHTLHLNRPLPQFREHAWEALANVTPDRDGLLRRYPFGETFDGSFLPSMGALLAGSFDEASAPFTVDFSIQPTSIPTVSYVDALRGDPATVARLRNSKVIVGGTAAELGDRFSTPNGRILSGPLLQAMAAESILQGRVLHPSQWLVGSSGALVVFLLMGILWRPWSALGRVGLLIGAAIAAEGCASLVQAKLPVILDTSLLHITVIAYLTAIALDEIDFRDLLGRIAERRFQRIAMALGDGLVCTDARGFITVWNPGAVAIFGYAPDEMIGQPFERICPTRGASASRFSIRDLTHESLQSPGGRVMELEGRRKNGEIVPLEACFSGWQWTDGFHYGVIMRDISVRKREAERIRYLAEHDDLTGLINRNTLCRVLSEARAGAATALLVIGLDRFHLINDRLGHGFGDQVLCAVAQCLREIVGSDGLVARLSGDEFGIVMMSSEAAEEAGKLTERLQAAFSGALRVDGRPQPVRIITGIAVYPGDCNTTEELLGSAHLALSKAKSEKRDHLFFQRRIRDELETRFTLEAELARALEHGEFELFYQPQVYLADEHLVGAESLIRWRHPVRGLLSPAEFMPVVNTSSLSESIGSWVMETAARQARRWQERGYGVRVAINLSPSQLQSGDLLTAVDTVLGLTDVSPSLLELEVTEDILLVDDGKASALFRKLRERGLRMVLDDFGTGYASLSYLKRFPLDGLKIDRSFVGELVSDPGNGAIVTSLVGLSRLLGLSVVAEGIEDRATADLLKSLGCHEGQGYFFGRPVPVAEFERKYLSPEGFAAKGSMAAA